MNDLTISVIDGKVRLRSSEFGREVIPVISHTYLSYLDDPIYKFLSAVAFQYASRGRFWNWGKYERWGHLPRVVYKNIIVSREMRCLERVQNNYHDVTLVNEMIDGFVRDKRTP